MAVVASLVPRPRPAFRCLQYQAIPEKLVIFSSIALYYIYGDTYIITLMLEFMGNVSSVVCTQNAVCNKHIPDFFGSTLELIDGILHHLGSFMLRRARGGGKLQH